ncbi:MAG: radical SAM protein [Deltaproteobacteria bacterium]|nr:radical SAM protein [Deltaproteobacteria bacterium]
MQLTLCLTHHCNLRCDYCYGGDKVARHMSLATGQAAIELGLERTSERLHLIFFGGEPLTRWASLTKLTETALERAASKSIELKTSVTTNGTLLTEQRVAWLKDHHFITAVSCDGTERAHDTRRRYPSGRGSHRRTIFGLKRALAAGLKVRVVLVVQPATMSELPASVDYLRGLGATDLVVNPDWSADWETPEIHHAWQAAYRAVGERYVAAYQAGEPFWISFIDTKIAAHIKDGFLDTERCDLGRRNLVVAPSGNLYPCDRMVGQDDDDHFVIGHATTGTDLDQVAKLVTAACSLPPECRDCAVALRCRNRCACANLAMTGSVEVPSATLCFHEQLAIQVADGAAARLYEQQNALFLRQHYGASP